MKLIGLDIEATDKGEMLELSIIRLEDKEEIYHSYFRPVQATTWRTDIHHITPAMVRRSPTVKKEKAVIQQILDEADGIVGFAVSNDLRYLENHGFKIPAASEIVEVRDWYWYYIGKETDMQYGTTPSLIKCAQALGFDYSEDTDAHSASNDTLVTLQIFDKILDRAGIENIGPGHLEEFRQIVEAEQARLARERAKGKLSLVKADRGYYLRNNSIEAEISHELCIEVESRFLAEHQLRERFKKKEIGIDTRKYDLKEADIKFFLSYRNTYDRSSEEFYRHIYNGKKSSRLRLNFNLR